MSEKANDEQRSETGDDHAKGDYVEVIDLDEFDAAEGKVIYFGNMAHLKHLLWLAVSVQETV